MNFAGASDCSGNSSMLRMLSGGGIPSRKILPYRSWEYHILYCKSREPW
jgi:hypothetical protein